MGEGEQMIGKCLPCLMKIDSTPEVLRRRSAVGNARLTAKEDNECECGEPHTLIPLGWRYDPKIHGFVNGED